MCLTIHSNESRIVVFSLPRDNLEVVKARRRTDKMPFPYQASAVACLLQKLGHSLLRTVEHTVLVIGKAVFVAMLARYHTGTTGT